MSSILVTGATGSFGTHYVRHLLNHTDTDRIIVYSRDEWKQAQLADALHVGHDHDRVRFFIGDVRDGARLGQAMRDVDVVIHAAALKRVDAGSYNPGEIKRTNVNGTENVCHAAIAAGVRKVVLLSSDKAVQPTNIYGASKMFAEHLTVQANNYGASRGVRLACVRYGNVLGSRGSVVHLWRSAIAAGAPLKLTDERMTRFWITLDGAVNLVQYALDHMQGGEIFVPKLHAMRLLDLASALAGGEDYPIQFVGLRPGGEKVHEALLAPHEQALDWGDAYLVPPEPHLWTSATWAGTPVPAGFVYVSDRVKMLTSEELQALLRSVP